MELNKSPILLTIITVVFNAEEVIANTLASVERIKEEWIEYIVIDGKSNDNTISYIKSFTSIIDYFISEPDLGIYDAMNKGIIASRGKYVSFLNAGDTLVNNYSSIVKHHLGSNDNDLIAFGIMIKHKKGELETSYPQVISKDYNPQHMYLPHPGQLVKRSMFKLHGFFDIKYKSAADLEWINRVIAKGNARIKYEKIPIVVFLAGGVSASYMSFRESREISIIYGKNVFAAYYVYLKQVTLLFAFSVKLRLSALCL